MKKILLLALPLMVMCAVSCEKDNSPIIQFKDPKFLHALLYYDHKDIDKNKDGQISEKEASVVTVLTVRNGVRNIDEIRYFTALEYLYCYNNQLTSLDLSNNTALTWLECYNNQLTTLDLSNNTALEHLYCYSNNISSLDVSMCRDLLNFYCVDYEYSYIDYDTKLPLESLKIYKSHIINDNNISVIEQVYGEILEYVE